MPPLSKLILFLVFILVSPDGLAGEGLEKMILEINGEGVLIDSGQEVKAVWGDEIEVKGAMMKSAGASPKDVNFVGFPNRSSIRPIDDRGYLVRSHKDLLEGWARNDEKNLYEIKAQTGKVHHGSVFVRLEAPKLLYVVMIVNGNETILREGEILTVNGADRFKVSKVVTNIDDLNKGVTFQITPLVSNSKLLPAGEVGRSRLFEIRFFRFNREFAKVPIHIRKG